MQWKSWPQQTLWVWIFQTTVGMISNSRYEDILMARTALLSYFPKPFRSCPQAHASVRTFNLDDFKQRNLLTLCLCKQINPRKHTSETALPFYWEVRQSQLGECLPKMPLFYMHLKDKGFLFFFKFPLSFFFPPLLPVLLKSTLMTHWPLRWSMKMVWYIKTLKTLFCQLASISRVYVS